MAKSPAEIARVLVMAVLTFVSVYQSAYAASGFQGLGDFPGGDFYSTADDISGDGQMVVGRGFRWTASGGMQSLGFTFLGSPVFMISADGSTIVGADQRWTAATGVVQIEGLIDPGDIGGQATPATALSGNGSTIVGAYTWESNSPWIWKAPAGPLQFTLPLTPTGISYNGQTLVGYSGQSSVMWNASTGITTPLGALPHESLGVPAALSYDGKVVVGSSLLTNLASDVAAAWRWTPTGGMVDLGGLGQSPRGSVARDVSADGAIVIGYSGQVDHPQAFIWAEQLGMLPLREWLIDNHITGLTGWQLTEAHAISADGRSIVGEGINPNGHTEAWLVRLPSPGDSNGDGLVDGADYIAWADHFLEQSNLFADGDFNWDGVVDGADYVVWADHFAPTHASLSISAVPEPSSLLLAGMGVAALLARLKRAAIAERPRHEVLHL